MNLKDESLKEISENYFQKSLMELLPSVVQDSIKKSRIRQEFISLNRTIKNTTYPDEHFITTMKEGI
jgi:hypothetical protein